MAMTEEVLNEYRVGGGALHHVTLDPGSLFYMPLGFIFAERTSSERTFGWRLGVFAKNDPTGLAELAWFVGERAVQKQAALSEEMIITEVKLHVGGTIAGQS